MDINKIKDNLKVKLAIRYIKQGNLSEIHRLCLDFYAGIVYELGIEVEKDFDKAREYYKYVIEREDETWN